jgi:hypothetical protein
MTHAATKKKMDLSRALHIRTDGSGYFALEEHERQNRMAHIRIAYDLHSWEKPQTSTLESMRAKTRLSVRDAASFG